MLSFRLIACYLKLFEYSNSTLRSFPGKSINITIQLITNITSSIHFRCNTFLIKLNLNWIKVYYCWHYICNHDRNRYVFTWRTNKNDNQRNAQGLSNFFFTIITVQWYILHYICLPMACYIILIQTFVRILQS